jgi:hypothetical protein
MIEASSMPWAEERYPGIVLEDVEMQMFELGTFGNESDYLPLTGEALNSAITSLEQSNSTG